MIVCYENVMLIVLYKNAMLIVHKPFFTGSYNAENSTPIGRH